MDKDLPFEEEWISNNESIRVFKSDVFDEELKWHFDEEDRVIQCIGETDWKFQFDNNLPIELKNPIEIKRGDYHRLIKGSGDLKISIKRI
jgi:hypothetical protein